MAKKKVPLWIKLLLPPLAAVLIFCVSISPSFLRGALAYGIGLQAQREGRYSTAIREYEKALTQFTDYTPLIARLAISYFHNERIDECSELLDRIAGKEVSGKLSRQVNEIIAKLDSTYYESSGLVEVLKLYGREELERTARKLEAYLTENKEDIMGIFHLANIYFDIGRYTEAEKLYIKAAELRPEFYSAHLNLAAVYRRTGQYEKAVESCNRVLDLNKEHPQAFVALSKIELERKNTAACLEYARKAYEYDSGDLHVISNLCLAYHHNGMIADRDKLFEILRQSDYYDMAALHSIIIEK